MSYTESSSNSFRMSRPLLYDHGNYGDMTLGDEGANSKPPDGSVVGSKQSLCINSDDQATKKQKIVPLGAQFTSFVFTRWRFLFLAMIASVSLGWYLLT